MKAPDHVVFDFGLDPDRSDVNEWTKFGERETKSSIYAGYENGIYGDETEYLYICYSKASGLVSGVKTSLDDIEYVSKHWADYDTPRGVTRGKAYIGDFQKLHLVEDA